MFGDIGGIVPETKFYKNDPVGSLDLDRALSDPIEDSSSGVRRGAIARRRTGIDFHIHATLTCNEYRH